MSSAAGLRLFPRDDSACSPLDLVMARETKMQAGDVRQVLYDQA